MARSRAADAARRAGQVAIVGALWVALGTGTVEAQRSLEQVLIGGRSIPAGYAPLPEATGPTEATLRDLGPADPARRESAERLRTVVASMDGSYMRAWVNRGPIQITAFVFDAGADGEAAAFLMSQYEVLAAQSPTQFVVEGLADARGFASDTLVQIVFRRGELTFLVAVAGAAPGDTALATRLARAQAARAPDGDTGPAQRGVELPRSYVAGQIVAALGMVVLFYVFAVRRVSWRAATETWRTAAEPPGPGGGGPALAGTQVEHARGPLTRHDIAPASRLRHRAARAVATGKALGSLIVVVSLPPILWPDSLPWMLGGAALVAAAVGTERGSRVGAAGLGAIGAMMLLGVVWSADQPIDDAESALGAMLVVVIATPAGAILISGSIGVFNALRRRTPVNGAAPDDQTYVGAVRTRYRRLLSGSRRASVALLLAGTLLAQLLAFALALSVAHLGPASDSEGAAARFVQDLAAAAIASGCVLGSVVLYRRARVVAQLGADDLMDRDRRAPVVLLRSFDDDDLLVRTHHSSRRAWLEGLGRQREERFEEVVAGHLWRYGPVITVGEPGRPATMLGAARAVIPDEKWREHVSAWMVSAGAIVVILGRSEGLTWEILRITALAQWHKTLIVFPPQSEDLLASRWQEFRDAVRGTDAPLECLSVAPGNGVLTLVWSPVGGHTAYTANSRGELDYEVALHAAAARLGILATRGARRAA